MLQYISLYYLNLFWAFSTSLIPWWMQQWERQIKVISDRDSLYLKIFYILSMISDRMNKKMTWKLFINSSLTETACIYKYLASSLKNKHEWKARVGHEVAGNKLIIFIINYMTELHCFFNRHYLNGFWEVIC